MAATERARRRLVAGAFALISYGNLKEAMLPALGAWRREYWGFLEVIQSALLSEICGAGRVYRRPEF